MVKNVLGLIRAKIKLIKQKYFRYKVFGDSFLDNKRPLKTVLVWKYNLNPTLSFCDVMQ
jgi:hypothetical protein